MSINPEENLFTSTIEKLLAGQFICPYSDALVFEQLERESYRREVNDYLERIGRTLAGRVFAPSFVKSLMTWSL
jgi:hypothetical protein